MHSSVGPIYVLSIKMPIAPQLLFNIIKARRIKCWKYFSITAIEFRLFHRNGHTYVYHIQSAQRRNVSERASAKLAKQVKNIVTFDLSQLHIRQAEMICATRSTQTRHLQTWLDQLWRDILLDIIVVMLNSLLKQEASRISVLWDNCIVRIVMREVKQIVEAGL